MMNDDHKSIIQALASAQENGQSVALATIIQTQGSMPRHAGTKMLIYADGQIVGTIGGGAMEAQVIQAALATLRDSQPRLETYTLNNLAKGDVGVCGGTAQIFIEPILTAPQLLIIGVGHVGVALAELGKWAGFRVVLCDDRAEFCHAGYVPNMDAYIVCKPDDIQEHIHIDNRTFIAALTRGLPIDISLIPALLATDAAYIGVIGSKRRWALTVKELISQHGIIPSNLARIHAPIGLEIEAETPKEIAISILAEIIMRCRGGTGQPMRQKLEDISIEASL
jgi:xanthine dehydrogenase accessory factor